MYKIMIALSILILGCGGTADMENAKKTLLETDREFARKSRETNPAEAFRTYLLDEALMLPDGGSPLKGRQNIFEHMNVNADVHQLDWEPEDGEVAGSFDFGYTWGRFTSTMIEASGKETVSKGKYLNIWKNDSNGNWRVLVDMGNKNP